MSNLTQNEGQTVQVDLEFLDHVFKIEVSNDIDLEELLEIIEKFIIESPDISLDLKSLAKTYLDTEFYSLILKQNNTLINNFSEIKIDVPIRLELESDAEKKRYFTKKRLKSTLRHLDSININEFINMFHIANVQSFKQNLMTLESSYPIKISDDVIYLTKPLDKKQLKDVSNQILDFIN